MKITNHRVGIKHILAFLIILTCCCACAQATQVSVEPPDIEASMDDTFTVNIMVYPEGNETFGGQYTLYFNNTLLNATDQSKGTFLSQDGVATTIYKNEINNTLGRIDYSEARTGVDYGVNDPGVLASITFKVIDESGTSELLLDRVKLSTPDATYITGIVVNNGNVEVTDFSGVCGDVSDDELVNIGDVILLANHVGNPDDPRYEVNELVADVNGDGNVNIGDVILLANHVGNPDDPRYILDCS